MTGMDDLITWLRRRLDEEQRDAEVILGENADSRVEGLSSTLWDEEDACARRVLAEVDVKRRIIDRYEDALSRQNDPEHSSIAADVQVSEYEDWVLPLLALPYAGRPGYLDEWRL